MTAAAGSRVANTWTLDGAPSPVHMVASWPGVEPRHSLAKHFPTTLTLVTLVDARSLNLTNNLSINTIYCSLYGIFFKSPLKYLILYYLYIDMLFL